MTIYVKTILKIVIILVISCKNQPNQQDQVGANNLGKVQNNPSLVVNKQATDSILDSYLSNDDYLAIEADINRDGLKDKIFSHKPYKGNELIFFVNKGSDFTLELKSINFSEDGGRIIQSIEPEKSIEAVLKINTYFPDGGTNEASYFIDYKKDWYLNKTIYRVSDWRETPAKNQICTLSQNLLLRNLVTADGGSKIKNLPIESERSKLCREENP